MSENVAQLRDRPNTLGVVVSRTAAVIDGLARYATSQPKIRENLAQFSRRAQVIGAFGLAAEALVGCGNVEPKIPAQTSYADPHAGPTNYSSIGGVVKIFEGLESQGKPYRVTAVFEAIDPERLPDLNIILFSFADNFQIGVQLDCQGDGTSQRKPDLVTYIDDRLDTKTKNVNSNFCNDDAITPADLLVIDVSKDPRNSKWLVMPDGYQILVTPHKDPPYQYEGNLQDPDANSD